MFSNTEITYYTYLKVSRHEDWDGCVRQVIKNMASMGYKIKGGVARALTPEVFNNGVGGPLEFVKKVKKTKDLPAGLLIHQLTQRKLIVQ